MPECRGCGVALAPHELELCQSCWDATEDDDEFPDDQETEGDHMGEQGRIIREASEQFGGLVAKEFYDRTLAKCTWRTSFTEETVVVALDTLMEMGWRPPSTDDQKGAWDG